MPNSCVDPKEFVITRKRKKYKFALFHNAKNCFELSEWSLLDKNNLVIEVGAGTALFLVKLAEKYPNRIFIAIDVKADRLQKGAREALARGLNNIFFVRARADQLLKIVKPGTVQQIWLTFSDPFPRKRDAKKRLAYTNFLELYKKAHVDKKAQLLIKTDNHAFFDWSLEQLVADKWRFLALSFDVHESNLPDDYKLTTTYEEKWIDEGRPIMLVEATS